MSPLSLSAQPGAVSEEEALRQAQELLRSLGYSELADAPDQSLGHEQSSASLASPTETAPNPPGPSPLTLAEIVGNLDIWPADVLVLENLNFGGTDTIGAGTMVGLVSINGDELLALHRNERYWIPIGLTDLVERANRIASGAAKEDGFVGRLPAQLAREAQVLRDGRMQMAQQSDMAGADVYLYYFGSPACGWCERFLPKLRKALASLDRDFPGRVKFIHASLRIPNKDYEAYVRKLEPDAALPPSSRLFVDAMLQAYDKTNLSIAQPSLLAMNVNGRILDKAMRDGSNLQDLEDMLGRIKRQIAESPESIRPDWVDRSPMPLEQPRAPAPNVVRMTDPTLTGPVAYSQTHNGIAVPGLVLFRDTGRTLVPALSLQELTTPDGQKTWSLSFREVEGPAATGMNRPLMAQWIRFDASNQAALAAAVDELKGLAAKFREWRQVAINNSVSDFRKVIAELEDARFVGRLPGPAFAIPGQEKVPSLDVLFIVGDDPSRATLQTATLQWSPDTIDAFLSLVDQAEALVTALPVEVARLESEREERIDQLQNVDDLFR